MHVSEHQNDLRIEMKNVLSYKSLIAALILGGAAVFGYTSLSRHTEIELATWRNDDFVIWHNILLKPFYETHPTVSVHYEAFAPDYPGRVRKAFELDNGPDVIACYPGKIISEFAQKGYVMPLDPLNLLEHYDPSVVAQWADGKDGQTYCLPVAAVGHGFIYNKRIFNELGLSVPRTLDEFHAVLDAVKADQRYVPMTMGLADAWIAMAMGLELIGPNFWNGDAGLERASNNDLNFSSPEGLAVLTELSTWPQYMEPRPFGTTRLHALERFSQGNVAILPTGSWDIPLLRLDNLSDYGVFAPPRVSAEAPCFMTRHNDLGFAINASTPHPKAAKEFLTYLAGDPFLQTMEQHLQGFFALKPQTPHLTEPLLAEFTAAHQSCEATQRLSVNRYFDMSGSYYNTLAENLIKVMQHPERIAEIAARLDALPFE